MGCYDTLSFACPACHESTSVQSKAAECMRETYTLRNAPLMIIADINDDGRKGRLFCENCNTQLILEVSFSAVFRKADPSSGDDEESRRIV